MMKIKVPKVVGSTPKTKVKTLKAQAAKTAAPLDSHPVGKPRMRKGYAK